MDDFADTQNCKRCGNPCERRREGAAVYHVCWTCKKFVIRMAGIKLVCWHDFEYGACEQCDQKDVLKQPPFGSHVCPRERKSTNLPDKDGGRLEDGCRMMDIGDGDAPNMSRFTDG